MKAKKTLFSLVALSLVLSPVAVSAATDTGSTTVTATVDSVISITTGGTVNINVVPTTNGSISSASDTISVSTNSAGGYVLSLANADGVSNLTNGGNTIGPTSGNLVGAAALDANTWGYRVDGVGDFGAGTTAAELNEETSAYTWAGVPVNSSPDTLKSPTSPVLNDETVVWYGVRVNSSLPNGTYSDTVTYTAVTQ